jgi:hypothetical protein
LIGSELSLEGRLNARIEQVLPARKVKQVSAGSDDESDKEVAITGNKALPASDI